MTLALATVGGIPVTSKAVDCGTARDRAAECLFVVHWVEKVAIRVFTGHYHCPY
jgi:hypothetical protein